MGFQVFAGCLTENGQIALKNEGSDTLIPFHLNVCSTDSIKESHRLVKKALRPNQGLWAIVNNAGIAGQLGPPDLNTVKGVRDTLDVNLYGAIEMCHTFLPLLRQYKGRIVNMTSMCGRIPAADGPYCASKYGLEGYSDILRRELYKENVKVSILEPDYFKTNILNIDDRIGNMSERLQNSHQDVKAVYGEKFRHVYSQRANKVFGRAGTNLNLVIDAYVHAITSRYPRTRYVVGFGAKFFFVPMSYVPDCILNVIISKLYTLLGDNKK